MRSLHIVLLAVLLAFLQGCSPEPVANFDYSFTDNTAPAEITFTNLSEDAESFRWEFGDGNTSMETSPVHTYTEADTYSVLLMAKGKGGEGSISKSVVINRPTTYIVRNLASFNIYNVFTFYSDGINYFDEVSHGTIWSGYQTVEYITTRPDIALMYEYDDGTSALVSTTYLMSPNMLNYIDLTDETLVYIDKSLDVNSANEMLSSRNMIPCRSSEITGSAEGR